MFTWLTSLFSRPNDRVFTVLNPESKRPLAEFYLIPNDGIGWKIMHETLGRPHPILPGYVVGHYSISFSHGSDYKMAEVEITYEHADEPIPVPPELVGIVD